MKEKVFGRGPEPEGERGSHPSSRLSATTPIGVKNAFRAA